MFEVAHKQISIIWGKDRPHGCTANLKKKIFIKIEIIILQDIWSMIKNSEGGIASPRDI